MTNLSPHKCHVSTLDRPAVNTTQDLSPLHPPLLLLHLLFPPFVTPLFLTPPFFPFSLFPPPCILSRRWRYVLIVVILLLQCALHFCIFKQKTLLFNSDVMKTWIKPITHNWTIGFHINMFIILIVTTTGFHTVSHDDLITFGIKLKLAMNPQKLTLAEA